MPDNKLKVNLDGFKRLARAFNGQYSIKVGIMGSKAARKNGDTEKTNAEIGFINEFGSPRRHIPARSFLRMPLTLYLGEYLKNKKSFSDEAIDLAIKSGQLLQLAEKIGLTAEEVVQEAFATRGFGQWVPNAPYTVEQKGSDSPLIDTGELRRSITSQAKKIK